MLKDQINRRIWICQVWVVCRSGSGIVGEADDQLQSSAPGSGEYCPDRVEAVLIERLRPVAIEPEVDPDQRIGRLQCPDLLSIEGLLWEDRGLFHKAPLRVGKVFIRYCVHN